jgi:ribosomal protein S12 methylthiotransferase accessory factor
MFSKTTCDSLSGRGLIDPRTGIIRKVYPMVRGASEPSPPYVYLANLAPIPGRRMHRGMLNGCGRGEAVEQARMGAIGECVERYCAFLPDSHRLRLARARDLDGEVITPADCILFLPHQYDTPGFPFRRYDDSQRIHWMPAEMLPGQRPAWVPAGFTYLLDTSRSPEHFAPTTSNGLAAGPTQVAARLAALCELIERDAFLLTWMMRRPGRRVDLSRVNDGVVAAICAHYARFGFVVRVIHIGLDIAVPVMMAMIRNHTGRGAAACVALGCHPDPRVALKKSLLELCQGWPGRWAESLTRPAPRSAAEVREMHDHSLYFARADRFRYLAFLWDSPLRPWTDFPDHSCGSPDGDLRYCVQAATAAGARVAFVDLTTSDVAECGFHVSRAFATRLQPMHFGFGLERLAGSRVFRVASKMGLSRLRGPADLNPCPHPLA